MLKKLQKSKGAMGASKPVADGTPRPPKPNKGCLLGSMKAEIKFLGDVIAPVFEEKDWKDSNE
ncbi:MAG TPA: hypothetical protein VFU50_04260 [Terriglobales bacterium]|nr:hypothetical protein [Terriglobales bacterium]